MVAQRDDLVAIHLPHRDWNDGQPQEYDDFCLGQVTSITRAGLARLYPGRRAFPSVILRAQTPLALALVGPRRPAGNR